jgi:Ribbon-helix-helix domain
MMGVSLSITPLQLGKLRAVAMNRGVSLSHLLRQAIELVLAEETL